MLVLSDFVRQNRLCMMKLTNCLLSYEVEKIMELRHIDPTELSQHDTYLINGCEYKYKTSIDASHTKQYIFTPVPGQKRKANIKLSRNKLVNDCRLIVTQSEIVQNVQQIV